MMTPSASNNEWDWVHLRDIRVDGILGVYPAERETLRPIRINLSVACDTRPAAETDDFADALNYELFEQDVIRVVQEGRFQLIETLANRVAEAILAVGGVQAVRVIVDKPGALPHTDSVAVELIRRRPGK